MRPHSPHPLCRHAPARLIVVAVAVLALPGVGACAGGGGDAEAAGTVANTSAEDSTALASAAIEGAPGALTLVGVIGGLRTPESVLHDRDQDVYFISNVNGNPSAVDGNGTIARVPAESLHVIDRQFIHGRPSAPLNAPKGMAITGDTLWVADIDVVRAFDRITGRPLGTISLAGFGAAFLNDIAVGPDSALYVTDTGIHFGPNGQISGAAGPSRIYRIAGRAPAVAVEGELLSGPNGIAWDSAGKRFVIAPFSGPTLLAWAPEGRPPNPRRLARGPGSFDGIGRLPNGMLGATTWADSSLYAVQGDTMLVRLIAGIEAPADFGVDRKRNRVMIPLFNAGRVVVYSMR